MPHVTSNFDELDDNAKERARNWFRDGALGSTRYDPAIYFSGFYSQGDGAQFKGNYEYAKHSCQKIRSYAPGAVELHQIADGLATVQRRNFYRITALISHRGRYEHSGNMDIEVDSSGRPPSDDDTETVSHLLRDFADWIYRALKREYEYQMSDETIDENIRCNEYEFDETGKGPLE